MKNLLWPRSPRKPNYYLAGYTLALFSFGTIYIATNVHLTQLMFIDNRNFPGGPEGYAFYKYSTALVLVPNSSYVIANWLADGLLLYRCKVIWTGNWWIIALPSTMFLGSISLSIMFLYQASSPNATMFTQRALDFGLPYFALSNSLNIILTLLICLRLILHQRQMPLNGKEERMRLPYYSRIISMLVESCALYSVNSMLFLGTYAAGNSASSIFLPILSQTQIIAPLLVVFRVASHRDHTSVYTQSLSKPTTGSGSGPTRIRFGVGAPTDVESQAFPLEDSPKFASFGDQGKPERGIISTTTTVDVA